MEELLKRMQTVLETQFQRIADMQVLIDRLNAERHHWRARLQPCLTSRGTECDTT
jgi:hypothetical protein